MKRSLCLVVTILVVAMAVPGMAGDKHQKNCDGTPDECAKKMAEKFAHKAWLGIEMETTDDGHYKITTVVPDSPAEQAGLEPGDVLMAINGQDYSEGNMKAVKTEWSQLEPGSKAKFTVLRKGGKLGIKATLGSVPAKYQKKYIQEHLAKYHQES